MGKGIKRRWRVEKGEGEWYISESEQRRMNRIIIKSEREGEEA
jgi:hypothetical protein